MYKIQYKYRKWDKEIKKSTAIKAIDLQHKNIQTTIDLYLNPEKFDEEIIRDIRINDSASFFNQLGQHRINHNSGRNDKIGRAHV